MVSDDVAIGCIQQLSPLFFRAFRAYALSDYPAANQHAAAMMLMIMNNLDHRVAQFPEELVTYGGNGQVFSNWAQACHCHTSLILALINHSVSQN